METKDQNIKYFYARNLVIFRIIFILIAMFFLLSIAPELWFNTVIFIIVLISTCDTERHQWIDFAGDPRRERGCSDRTNNEGTRN